MLIVLGNLITIDIFKSSFEETVQLNATCGTKCYVVCFYVIMNNVLKKNTPQNF